VVWLGEPVLDAICLANHVEAHLMRSGSVAVAGLLGELDAPFDCLLAVAVQDKISVRIVWMR
jgi:hypothetical protein